MHPVDIGGVNQAVAADRGGADQDRTVAGDIGFGSSALINGARS